MPTTHHNIVRNTATTKIENARRTRAKNTSERFALREMADNAVMANPSRPACTRLRSLAVVVALLATSAAVYASDAKDLDEVVVSAGRRPQSWLEIGASLSRIAADETGVVDLLHVADALNRAPGVYMQRGSGQESLLAIRSPVLTGAGACGAFLVMEDGFPIRPVGFCNVNEMFEINTSQAAAIEVLRGPGTAVMGANAVHGSVSVLTPAVGDIRNSAALVAGSAELRSARFSLASEPQLGLAAYGLWRNDGGFRDHSATRDRKLNLLRDSIVFDGQLRLRAAFTKLDQQTAGFLRGYESYRDPVLRRINANPEAFRNADANRLSIDWTRGGKDTVRDELRLTLRDSSMEFLQHFLLGKPLERNGQRSVAAAASRAAALSESLQYRLGVDLETSRGWLLEVQNGPTLEGSAAARAIRPAGKHYDYSVDARVIGLQAQLGGPLGRHFDWQVAVRGDDTRYAYDNRMRDGNTAEDGSACGITGCLYNRPADRTDRYSTLTPRLEFGWIPTSDQRFYFTASNGFRPPEATELYRLQRNQSVADLHAERMRASELGWHHRGSNWRFSLAAFDATRTAVILRDANGFNVPDGKTTHRGVEYEWQYAATPDIDVTLAGSRARHRYAFSRAIDGGETIVAGKDIDTAPRALDTLEITWRPTSFWTTGLTVRRVGDYYADAANEHRQSGHTVADLRVSARLGGQWRTSLNVDNLTDRLFADRADFAQGEWRYFPAPRRSVFLTLEWQAPR